MRQVRKFPFTYCLPDSPNERFLELGSEEWRRHGGRWVIFNRRKAVDEWVTALAPYIDSGTIREAKYYSGFTGDPSALIVYTLDSELEESSDLLRSLGVRGRSVWEYETQMTAMRHKLVTIARSMIPGPVK